MADELRKLQHLREQGVLTTQEFDKQKARLLH
ncbi:SHOCT domain-containing protein [Hymenobacter sp. BT730]|nr:SHOCT domain-containing protein [Hymenobacter sp. BT730]